MRYVRKGFSGTLFQSVCGVLRILLRLAKAYDRRVGLLRWLRRCLPLFHIGESERRRYCSPPFPRVLHDSQWKDRLETTDVAAVNGRSMV